MIPYQWTITSMMNLTLNLYNTTNETWENHDEMSESSEDMEMSEGQ